MVFTGRNVGGPAVTTSVETLGYCPSVSTGQIRRFITYRYPAVRQFWATCLRWCKSYPGGYTAIPASRGSLLIGVRLGQIDSVEMPVA